MESVSNYMAEKGKVRGVAPLFSKLVVSSSGNDHTDGAERDDEDRADVLAIGKSISEV